MVRFGFGGDLDTRSSRTGRMFRVTNGPVSSMMSTLQKTGFFKYGSRVHGELQYCDRSCLVRSGTQKDGSRPIPEECNQCVHVQKIGDRSGQQPSILQEVQTHGYQVSLIG
jgi:hypothetical protein